MPLTHDMGIIGFHLVPLVQNITQYLLPPELFMRQPQLWLQVASEVRATLLASPNFGYAHYLRFFDAATAAPLDLSSVRLIFNGAEPIAAELCERFTETMSSYGLRRGDVSSLRPG
jgi:acyl-CoA synthetase (AMP-forming)/AMP-acid ligase II